MNELSNKSSPHDHSTTRKTVQNLWLGAGCNIIGIPLAAGIITNKALWINPEGFIHADTFSTCLS